MSFHVISGPETPTIDLEDAHASQSFLTHISNLVEDIDISPTPQEIAVLQGTLLFHSNSTIIYKYYLPCIVFVSFLHFIWDSECQSPLHGLQDS
jgi:hypothetical protein